MAKKWSIQKKKKWQLLADCIRSGQVEASELHEEFQKDFISKNGT